MIYTYRLLPVLALLLAGACTTMPNGPSILVLPGTGKSLDQFRADDVECRQFALAQLGGATPAQAANESGARSSAVDTAGGAVKGVATDGGTGAAVGAGAGPPVGAAAGAGTAESSGSAVQRQYDFGYLQCMYAKGHRIPVPGDFMYFPPAPGTYTPPPPPPS